MIEAAKVSADPKTEPASRLRILVLDEEFPFPPDSGKRIRTWNLVRRLAAMHLVRWVCFGPLSSGQEEAAKSAGISVRALPALAPDRGFTLLRRLVVNLFSSLPYSVQKHTRADFRDAVRDEVSRFQPTLIQCEWGPYAVYADDGDNIPVVIVAHNVESRIWERRAALAGNAFSRWFFGLQAKRMERFEREYMPRAQRLITVSDVDAQTFRAWGAECLTVENGVDLDFYSVDPAAEVADRLLFLASLDWFPNIDALNHLVADILPLIRQKRPQAKLRVVGRRMDPADAKRFAQVSGVEVVGEVQDVRNELRTAAVVLVPLRIGGGSRLKILEALAAGKAVVSTTIGAEGLDVKDKTDLLVADDTSRFADSVCQLLSDPTLRHTLGSNGRALVEAQYGWKALAKKMDEAWQVAGAGVQR